MIRYIDRDGTWHEVDGKRYLVREDGRVEWLCEHGVGHTIGHVKAWDASWMGVHGCCGCCAAWDPPGEQAAAGRE